MIYLDYSATTPLDPAVLKKMLPYFSREFANPASVHTPGQTALKAVDDVRHGIAELLQCRATELVFTSGATEANNLILKGLAADRKGHIVTTKIEHDSILEPLHYLQQQGIKVTYLDVDTNGLVKPEAVISALQSDTFLVSIGYVNSEVGTIQPLKKIGRLIKNHTERELKKWLNTSPRTRGKKPQPVYFHSDATQAANFCDLNIRSLHLDAMSLSGHKIYGPKGIGLLYARNNLLLKALLHGGHQERNIRSGTLNVPGIIGFGSALRAALQQQNVFNARIAKLRDRLIKKICAQVKTARVNTDPGVSSPSHAHITFPHVEGDILQAALDEKGIAVSTGSACAAGNVDVSHVLTAMGRKEEAARSSIRFTIGRLTTASDIDRTVRAVAECYKRLAKAS